MTIGMSAVAGSARKRSTTVKPSTSGISRSRMTSPAVSRAASAMPSSPPLAFRT